MKTLAHQYHACPKCEHASFCEDCGVCSHCGHTSSPALDKCPDCGCPRQGHFASDGQCQFCKTLCPSMKHTG